jgi:hypothetical protein
MDHVILEIYCDVFKTEKDGLLVERDAGGSEAVLYPRHLAACRA